MKSQPLQLPPCVARPMQPYLVFTLAANLAAMGELAGHERRGSLGWPGRSAILGLLAAALGRRRTDDFSDLDALDLAVAIFDEGVPLRDYHTVETVPSAAVKRPNSRPEALRAAHPLQTNTTITLRDYRCGSVYAVAVWGGELEELAKRLREPVFTLYLGRKSCPLSAPPSPTVVLAPSPQAAVEHARLPNWLQFDQKGYPRVARQMAIDAAHVPDAKSIEEHHDQPLDRMLWHFAPRRVALCPVNIQLSEHA